MRWNFSTPRRPSAAPRPQVERLEDRLVPAASVNETFVATLYQGILHRDADPGGLAFFARQLDAGASRGDVARLILTSHEAHEGRVRAVFQDLLGRDPDAGGGNFWVGQMDRGATEDQVRAGVYGSDEFFARAGGTIDGFLRALYHKELGRGLDDTGASFFGTQLINGASRAAVAGQVLASAEAAQRLVRADYRQLLGRDADDGGLAFWAGAVQHGARREEVKAGILASGEYLAPVQDDHDHHGGENDDPNAAARRVNEDNHRFRDDPLGDDHGGGAPGQGGGGDDKGGGGHG